MFAQGDAHSLTIMLLVLFNQGKPMWSIILLTSATVIFRCDILVLLGPFTLQLLLSKEVCIASECFSD